MSSNTRGRVTLPSKNGHRQSVQKISPRGSEVDPKAHVRVQKSTFCIAGLERDRRPTEATSRAGAVGLPLAAGVVEHGDDCCGTARGGLSRVS